MIKENRDNFDDLEETFQTKAVSSKTISISINYLDDVLQDQKIDIRNKMESKYNSVAISKKTELLYKFSKLRQVEDHHISQHLTNIVIQNVD